MRKYGLILVLTALLAASVVAGRPQSRAFEPLVLQEIQFLTPAALERWGSGNR